MEKEPKEEKDILQEAILDAKKVRATALANAKAALEEAFKPRLQSIISAKIKEDVGDEDEENPEENPVDNTGDEVLDDNPEGLEDDGEAKEVPIEVEPEDGGIKIEPEDPEVSLELEPEGEPEGDELGDDEDLDLNLEPDENPEGTNEEDDDLNIESIIKELEEETDVEPEVTEEAIVNELNDEDVDINIEPEEGTIPECDENMDEDVDIDIEPEPDEEINVNDEREETLENLQSEHIKLQEQHSKAIKVVKYLKDKLNEINLMNAKLLYTNKIFKSYENLNNSSKMKIVESIDRAKNVREAKLIYVTLTESLANGATKKQNPNFVKTITENLASRKIASTKPARKVINEETENIKQRFQKLANINILKD